jgi:hypothetical protein
MDKDTLLERFKILVIEAQEIMLKAQLEYASQKNVFVNFERIAAEQGIKREQVLLVYARKHWDGIVSHVRGHKLQREPVRGRIIDLMVYMSILAAMEEGNLP